MLKASFGKTSVCVVLAGLLGVVAAAPAFSQDVVLASAVTAPSPTLSQEQIDAFKASPTDFLARHPLRGSTTADRMRLAIVLSGEVKDIVISDIATLDQLLELSKTATPDQQRAIGAGLNRAAQAYVVTKPELATLIQERVVASGLMELQTAFLAGNLQTAAFFSAGAGRRSGAGAIGGGSGPGTNFIEDPVATQGQGNVVISSGGTFFDIGDDDDDNDDDPVSPVRN